MKLILICLFLAGCATEDKYTPILQSYVGSPSGNVISHFGPPNNSYDASGMKYLEFDRNLGMATFALYGTLHSVPRYCKTYFTVGADDLVKDARWEGNACN